jgi:hypothetical protein
MSCKADDCGNDVLMRRLLGDSLTDCHLLPALLSARAVCHPPLGSRLQLPLNGSIILTPNCMQQSSACCQQ